MDFKQGARLFLSAFSLTVLLAAGPAWAGETGRSEEPAGQTRASGGPVPELIYKIPLTGMQFVPGQGYAVREVSGAATPAGMQPPLAGADKRKAERDRHERD